MKRQVPEGASVKYSHGRRVKEQHGTFYRMKLRSWKDSDHTPEPRGGRTSVRLTLPNGEEVWGIAECSTRDNYSKKIGRDIALGRALAAAEKKYPELFKAKEEAKA